MQGRVPVLGVKWALSLEGSIFLRGFPFPRPRETARTSAGILRAPASAARCARAAPPPRSGGRAGRRRGSGPSRGLPARPPGAARRGEPLTRQARSRSKSRARRNRSRKASLSGRRAGRAPASPARRRSSARLGCSSGEWSGSPLSCAPAAGPGRASAMPAAPIPPLPGRRGEVEPASAPPPRAARARPPPAPPAGVSPAAPYAEPCGSPDVLSVLEAPGRNPSLPSKEGTDVRRQGEDDKVCLP